MNTWYLFLVRSHATRSVKIGEVGYDPVKADASKRISVEVNLHNVPGVAGACEVRCKISVATLACRVGNR